MAPIQHISFIKKRSKLSCFINFFMPLNSKLNADNILLQDIFGWEIDTAFPNGWGWKKRRQKKTFLTFHNWVLSIGRRLRNETQFWHSIALSDQVTARSKRSRLKVKSFLLKRFAGVLKNGRYIFRLAWYHVIFCRVTFTGQNEYLKSFKTQNTKK